MTHFMEAETLAHALINKRVKQLIWRKKTQSCIKEMYLFLYKLGCTMKLIIAVYHCAFMYIDYIIYIN